MNEFAWNTWSQEQAIRYFLSNYLNQSEKGVQWIQSILADTGSYFDADRCYIFETNGERTAVSNTYEWCREGITAKIKSSQDISVDGLRE